MFNTLQWQLENPLGDTPMFPYIHCIFIPTHDWLGIFGHGHLVYLTINSQWFGFRDANNWNMLLCHLLALHVVYKTDKKPDEPCSITSSLAYFPDEDPNDLNVTSPPRVPPSNLTVVTVEGCPSFVILDWEKSDNETRGKVQPNKMA